MSSSDGSASRVFERLMRRSAGSASAQRANRLQALGFRLVVAAGLVCLSASTAAADSNQVILRRQPSTMHYQWNNQEITSQQYQAVQLYQESLADVQAGRWQVADEKLKRAIADFPQMYQAHSNRAVVLAHIGRLAEADQEAKTAETLAPDAPEPLLARASIDQSLGKSEEALTEYNQLLNKYPNYKLAPQIRSVISHLNMELAARTRVDKEHPGAEADKSDYFDYATDEAVEKWNTDKFPLKVYIPSDQLAAKVAGYKPSFAVALRDAFQQWQSESGNLARFQFVDNPESADIDCRWSSNPLEIEQPAEGGHAYVYFDAKHGIGKSKVAILTRMAGGVTDELTPDAVRMISLHEIGHSLGLIGHSPDPGDIMFCSMSPSAQPRTLSSRDLRTLSHLYRPDVQFAVHNRPSGTVTKASLNNEGTELAAQGQFEQATQKFEAALKLDPSYEVARLNLASCLNNLGISAIKQGDAQTALDRFNRALKLQGEHGDAKTRASILNNMAIIYDRLGRPDDARAARAQAQKLANGGA